MFADVEREGKHGECMKKVTITFPCCEYRTPPVLMPTVRCVKCRRCNRYYVDGKWIDKRRAALYSPLIYEA